MWFYDFHARFLFFWSFLIYLALSEWFDAQDITTLYYIILFMYLQDKIYYFSTISSIPSFCVWRNENRRFECRICVLRLIFRVFNQIRYEHSYWGEWPDVPPYNNIYCYHSPTIILQYYIIQRGVQQKCNTETEKLKNFFSITIAIPWISTLPIFRNIQATRIGR